MYYSLEVLGNGTVITACTFIEALNKYQQQKCDLFLLDINLPDGHGSGMNFCRKLRETLETPVIFLTANDTEDDMIKGFDSGCDDYIAKPFSTQVLRKKVQAILKRSGTDTSKQFHYKDLEIDTDKCLVTINSAEIHLTSTEYKLLNYLVQNKGKVLTRTMLLENLWDIDGNFIDENTIRVNILRLRQKLCDDNQEYIITVFGMGYTFGD